LGDAIECFSDVIETLNGIVDNIKFVSIPFFIYHILLAEAVLEVSFGTLSSNDDLHLAKHNPTALLHNDQFSFRTTEDF
jgi:hypothetical protein